VVDDHEDSRNALCALLELSGHTVRDAADGATGLAIALAWQPDTVCLDLGLPDGNGAEVATQIRAAFGAHAPLLVAVTGYADTLHREQADAAGFDAYFLKPYDIETFLEILGGARRPALAAVAEPTRKTKRA
jgi:two-component system CheB/CheR fusion protein